MRPRLSRRRSKLKPTRIPERPIKLLVELSGQCVFCEIVRGESPASFTYQDDSVVAFMDVQPITHGHMLVVPREHAVLMSDLSAQLDAIATAIRAASTPATA